MKESWKTCSRDAKYEVSNHGRIRRGSRILKPRVANGYLRVMLSGGALKRKNYYLHVLVCEAFHGSAPAGKPMALHWDDNRINNHASNLRWGDAIDNQRDAVRNGSYTFGAGYESSRSHSEHTHLLCRRILKEGLSTRKVSAMTGVAKSTVALIASNKHFTSTA